MNTKRWLYAGALASAGVLTVACSKQGSEPARHPPAGTAPGETPTAQPAEPVTGEVGAVREGSEATQEPRTYVFECGADKQQLTVRTEQGFAYLVSKDYAALPLVEGGDSPAYQLGGSRVLIEGERALVDLDTGERLECTNRPELAAWENARERGVTFRGVGNEPRFVVEIGGDNVSVVTDAGKNQFTFAKPEADVSGGATVYRGSAQQRNVTVTIEDRECRDSVTQQEFGSRVRVEVDSTTYEGCGRSLE